MPYDVTGATTTFQGVIDVILPPTPKSLTPLFRKRIGLTTFYTFNVFTVFQQYLFKVKLSKCSLGTYHQC
jgi:hypothetical protein